MNAIISPCGNYRYALYRPIPGVSRKHLPVLFIMLNPSTADAVKDDPTIRRCIGFADRLGGSELTVVNLFALRATDPGELLTAADPVGPRNDEFLLEEIARHRSKEVPGIILCAWGANPMAVKRQHAIKGDFHCLGLTKKGAPKHPLYLPWDSPVGEYICG
jgi:hypothetical protein